MPVLVYSFKNPTSVGLESAVAILFSGVGVASTLLLP